MELSELTNRKHLLAYALAGVTLLSFFALSSASVLTIVHLSYRNPTLIFLLIAAFLVRSFIGLPISFIFIFIGFKYPLTLAVPIAFAGGVLSSLPPYLVARYLQTPYGLIGAVAEKGQSFISQAGDFTGVIAARISAVPSDVVSYGSGLSGVPFRTYLCGTAIGWAPIVVIFVLMGNSMQSLRNGSIPPEFVFSGTLLAIFLVATAIFFPDRE